MELFLLFPLGIIESNGKTAHLKNKNRAKKGTLKTEEGFGDHRLGSTTWGLTKQSCKAAHKLQLCGLIPTHWGHKLITINPSISLWEATPLCTQQGSSPVLVWEFLEHLTGCPEK